MSGDGDTKPRGKWAKLIPIASALIVAATPGVYSAWQSARQAWEQRLEKRVRDTQEGDLQAAVKANADAIKALKGGMVTHRDLLDLVVKLRAEPPAATHRPRTSSNRPAAAPRGALDSAIAKLRGKARGETAARQKAAQALKRAPALKPAAKVRDQIQQKAAF